LRRRWFTVLLIAFFVVCFLHTRPVSSNGYELPDSGPYIDKVVYVVIPDQNDRWLALQSGYVDIDSTILDNLPFLPLGLGPDESAHEILRNGYEQITFNCREYPLNISGFRRAFAYAFDKRDVVTGSRWYGHMHDSLVPSVNPFCVEDELEWNWYEDESDSGNAILDDLNFTMNPVTGVRDAPNGNPFSINLGFFGPPDNDEIAMIAKEALEDLHVMVRISDPCCNSNMILHERDFTDYDISWLASEYGSAFVNETMINLSGFSNSTFDMWGEQLLNSRSYEAVFHAASEMQKILHYEVPSVVVYENYYFQMYRTDKFKDHIEDLDRYITGYWTMLNIKRVDGLLGGTLVVAVDQDPDSFNFFSAESNVSKILMDMMYLGLYTRTPELEATPQLAKGMVVETHEDNPYVSKGHTRYILEMKNDLFWTDGVPVTADDVAFTFRYILDSDYYGNPMAEDLTGLVAVYAPNPMRVVVEFDTESYWNFEKFAYSYILPKHVLEEIGLEDWDNWSLTLEERPHILERSCGPFIFTDYEPNEFYELSVNPDWRDDPYNGLPASDISIIPVEDFSTMLPFFQFRWDLTWDHQDYYYPFDYTILLDGEHFLTSRWYGYGTINVNVNDPYLFQGTHNFTIIIETLHHGLAIDTVIVTIQVSMYQVTPILGLVLPFAITGFFMVVRKTLKPRRVIEIDRGPRISGLSIIL
jgi:ABC-type transport system substrate-binding protein